MKLRPPSVPLITIDPFFSIWSPADKLTDTDTVHWTDFPNIIIGSAEIDGKKYRIIGRDRDSLPVMKQVSLNVEAYTTTYVFEQDGVRLTLLFTSPLLLDDLYYLTRPVSYLEIKKEITDHKKHTVKVSFEVSEQVCVDIEGDDEIDTELIDMGKIKTIKMGSRSQKILTRDGDGVRIEWGYFYLSSNAPDAVCNTTKKTVTSFDRIAMVDKEKNMTFASVEATLASSTLFTFAYDDIYSIQYFGKNLRSYWNRDGQKIEDEIVKAFSDYRKLFTRCKAFGDKMFADAVRAGGEKYAELLELALRQVIAAHKLVLDENGEILWISKECYSNGCAATVDVSYPSIPLFLLYNTELIKGMLRPIYKYSASEEWTYDFAPHDAGRYPLLNGQQYGLDYKMQMPVEECGNMLIMEAAVAIAENDASFAAKHIDILDGWVKYLIENGRDPEDQLCTDDFAGHLAHNCNLTLKAIMGLACYGILKGMLGEKRIERKYLAMARDMAKDWAKRAANDDGSYRLTFDTPDSFSMKYNIVWDKLFGTNIMSRSVIESEVASYRRRSNTFGMPLDNRHLYTKSDWLVWCATLAESREDFEALIEPMWSAFNTMTTRVPLTDIYWTHTSLHKEGLSLSRNTVHTERIIRGFRNRTVQGGLFMKLLEYKGIMKIK